MIRSANDARRRRDAAPLPPSEHAAQKLRMPEWFVSSLMMDRALDAVVRRAKTLDRKHDIPYLAGYSKDGKTIYIDRHMPSSFRYDGRDINTDRYLILHEEVEKTLIDQLNLHYLPGKPGSARGFLLLSLRTPSRAFSTN